MFEEPIDETTPEGAREARWAEVQEQAFRLLERSEKLPPLEPVAGLAPWLRLWHHPSDDLARSWTILLPAPGAPSQTRPVIRRLRWNSAHDRLRVVDPREGLAHAHEPIPTIDLFDRFPDPAALEGRLTALAAIPMPPLNVERPIGDDGEVFGLRELDTPRGLWLSWWCDGPPEWRAVSEWAREMRKFCEGLTD